MSGFEYDRAGQFSSAADATDWARRNNIDPRDLHISNVGDGEAVHVSVRRGQEPKHIDDAHNRRRDGFFD